MYPLVSEQQPPHYQYLQIELTSRCNLSCQTCLRAVPGLKLQEQDLAASALQRLQPSLQQTASVHLQGWGESMLLDDLPEQIRWFKSQGCRVSFTTNGTLLTPARATQLISSGLDGITFSMAGATAATQDSLRGAGTHVKLWNSLRLLKQKKKELNSRTPTLAVSYLLTPETMVELPQAVKQCRPLGLALFAGVHLTHAATEQQERMGIHMHPGNIKIKQIIRRAHWQAFLGRMRLQLPPFQASLLPVCDKNPLAGCFIAADGSVSPCVFLAPPAAGQQEHWYNRNGSFPAPRKCFGTLHSINLDQIRQSSTYRAFRNSFKERRAVYDREMAEIGIDLDGIENLERAQKRIRRAFKNMPVPDCCSRCVKMEGF
jgi:MoaA/NifB/PqqE/SkfB family radical SAM enzyme